MVVQQHPQDKEPGIPKMLTRPSIIMRFLYGLNKLGGHEENYKGGGGGGGGYYTSYGDMPKLTTPRLILVFF